MASRTPKRSRSLLPTNLPLLSRRASNFRSLSAWIPYGARAGLELRGGGRAEILPASPDGATYVGQWWKGKGSLIDFTNPAAKKWWQDQIGRVIAMGADGFKNDDAEGGFVGDVVFAGGQDPPTVRNRYAVEYNRAAAEALEARMSGDNDAAFTPGNGLPTVVTAALNAGMNGISLWVKRPGRV